ncbi:hypothetical protein NL676_031103 [Syzygium grande]|nr:hypothetical protein NL676_031103 [Syzygium grande]
MRVVKPRFKRSAKPGEASYDAVVGLPCVVRPGRRLQSVPGCWRPRLGFMTLVEGRWTKADLRRAFVTSSEKSKPKTNSKKRVAAPMSNLEKGLLIGAIVIVMGFYAAVGGKSKEEEKTVESNRVGGSLASSGYKIPLLQDKVSSV